MPFFLNNNTISVFKAAKMLTAQSKDFVIHTKTIERSGSLFEIMEAYGKAAEICAEMEELSIKTGLATGVGAAEDRVDELIELMKKVLTSYIGNSSNPSEAAEMIMGYENILADEIIAHLKESMTTE